MPFRPKTMDKPESAAEVLKRPLEPIKEEYNDMALVPVTYENQKKQRNELLKAKAKMFSKEQSTGQRVLYDEDLFKPSKEKTFVTGGGLPGRMKKADDSDDDYFMNEEDELLEIVEKQERDMKDMLKYLNEVEDMMGGNDLAHIRQMIRYTTETMDHHIQSYDKIKSHVDEMNKGKFSFCFFNKT